MTGFESSFSQAFLTACIRLSPTDAQHVWKAFAKFCRDPQLPGLGLEKLVNANGLHSIRASRDLRVILMSDGQRWIAIDAGQHDEVYARVERRRLLAAPSSGLIVLVSDPRQYAPDDHRPRTIPIATPQAEPDRGLFDHWTDADLRDAQFDDTAIAGLRGCQTVDDLFDCDLAALALERAFELIEKTPEEWRSPALLGAEDDLVGRLQRAIANFGAAHGLSQFFTPDELARLARAPIEEWMIFLHPDQRTVVERRFDGPARIRGAAGTGKTAVALHRAAALARRFAVEEPEAPPILFTTFIKTLPPVFESLYRRLPGAPPGGIEFTHVDRLAWQTVSQAGHHTRTEPNDINAAFSKAKQRVVQPGSPLASSQLTDKYLRDEVQRVIKGRGIESLADYLDIDRTGRVVPFTRPLREQMWELKVAWDEEMERRGTIDFADVIRWARDLARATSAPRFRAAIIDEAQDLTLVGLQFVQALVTDPTQIVPADGLLLVGDGAQRVYPGGYTLRQAGIEVSGRSTILKANYRNTAEILAAAMAVAGDLDVDDLGEEFRRGDADVTSLRSGGHRPIVTSHPTVDAERSFVTDRIKHLISRENIAGGDIGVFLPTNQMIRDFLAVLRAEEIDAVNLERSEVPTSGAVKVGSYHRAKGLEVKVVFLPFVNERFPLLPRPGQDPSEHTEERNIWISALFVAMTRARDELIISCTGNPSSLIIENLNFFDLVEY